MAFLKRLNEIRLDVVDRTDALRLAIDDGIISMGIAESGIVFSTPRRNNS